MGRFDHYMGVLEKVILKREEVRYFAREAQQRNRRLFEEAYWYLKKVKELENDFLAIKEGIKKNNL